MTFCRPTLLMVTAGGFFAWCPDVPAKDKKAEETPVPIKALLVTGGCSHDYTTRKGIIVQGIRERIKRPIEWMVKHQGDGESDVRISLFEESGWATGYDIVVHDYCFPRVREGEYIERILAPHRAGLPAVLIHGTMMSFQTPDDRWSSFTGATIRGHDRQGPVGVEPLALSDPILKGFQPWNIPLEELYRVDRLAPAASALIGALPLQPTAHRQPPTGLRPPPTETPVAWTHRYGPSNTRVFATTLGNDLSTLITPEYLDLLARGFLWALNDLSDSNTVIVPPGLSLKGLKIAIPQAGLPEVGPNDARLGKASALASGSTEATSPGRAIDGQSSTYWESDAPGPSSWQVEFPKLTTVGAVALVWKEVRHPEFLIEGAREGSSWLTLTRGPATDRDSTLSVLSFNPLELTRLRVSIPSTPPGYIPGIREVAVYSSVDEIPSGLPGVADERESESPFRTAGKSGFARKVRLAPGWAIKASIAWEAPATPIQLIPTASGRTFLLTETVSAPPKKGGDPEMHATGSAPSGSTADRQLPSADRPRRQVHLLSPPADGTFSHSLFLDGLDPGTEIAWDGEWLYTFSGGRLEAYRNLTGEGAANERRRVGKVFSLPEGASFSGIEFSDMHPGDDGWLYVRFRSPRAWEAYDSRGESVLLQERGMARFHPSGKGFSEWRDTELNGEAMSIKESGVEKIAQVEGLAAAARDGRLLWTANADDTGTTIACLEEASGEPPVPILWDRVGDLALFDYLNSTRQSVRKEVIPEILRRKRNPAPDLEEKLSTDLSFDLRTGLLSALTTANPTRSLALLVPLCQSTDPSRQVLAFRHLGDHPLAQNHPIFQQITTSITPSVTIEILGAILRSDTEMEGLDDLVLSFTSHPDSTLVEAARNFLISRESSAACFKALDDTNRKNHWKGAFDVLSELKRPTVVEGVALRLERTTSSEFRRLGLEALCRLYYREADRKSTWEGTRIADLFLRGSLRDHRVDRPTLLNSMLHYGIPLREPEVVANLARNEIPLEPLAVEALLTSEHPISSTTATWLVEIAKSPSRDEEMRTKAEKILSGKETPDTAGKNSTRPVERSNEEVGKVVEPATLDVKAGRQLFTRIGCGTCHNIHGEGPSFAPDIAASVGALTRTELIEALREPAKKIAPGYETRLFELKSGRQLKGLVEGRDSTMISLRDRAGNSFSIPVNDILFEWTVHGSAMPTDVVSDLTPAEIASLIQFLMSLNPES